MMRNQKLKYLLLGAASVIFFGTALAADSLAELKSVEVACTTSATQLIGGSATAYGSSIYVANDSATCVRIGGSNLTATTGASIGSGCRDGSGISIDTRKAWCFSTSGTVTVDVIYGVK